MIKTIEQLLLAFCFISSSVIVAPTTETMVAKLATIGPIQGTKKKTEKIDPKPMVYHLFFLTKRTLSRKESLFLSLV